MNEKNILISVKLDENKIASRLKEIKTAINGLEKDNEKLKTAMDKLGDSTGNFSRAIETNNSKIKSLQGEYSKLESKLADNNKSTKNLADQTKNLNNTEEKLSSSLKDVSGSLSSTEKELKEVDSALKETNTSTDKLADSQNKLGDSYTNNTSKIQQFENELNESDKKIDDFKNKISQLESKEVNISVNVSQNGSLPSNDSKISLNTENAITDVNRLDYTLKQTISTTNLLKQAFISLGAEGAASVANLVQEVAQLAAAISSENYVAAIGQAINLVGTLREEIQRLGGTFQGEFAPLNETFEEASHSSGKFGKTVREEVGHTAHMIGVSYKTVFNGFKNFFKGLIKEHKGFKKAWKDGWREAGEEAVESLNIPHLKKQSIKEINEVQRRALEAADRIQKRNEEILEKERQLDKANGEEKIKIENEIKQLQLKNAEDVWKSQEAKLKAYEDALKAAQSKAKNMKVGSDGTILTDNDTIDTSKLNEAAYEQLIKLRQAAAEARDQYKTLDEEVNHLNSTFEKQIEILHQQESLSANRRKYESDEIDRVQKIIELRHAYGNKDKEILAIQKESLQEKIKLIEEELSLERKKMEVVGESSDAQIEKIHQLEMELKRTQYSLQNLNNGFSSAEVEASGLGSILGNLTNKVGESSQALSLLGITGASSIKRISTGIKALSKLMTSWVGIVIAAVIIAIRGITKAFQENQALMNSLKNLYEAFEPILEAFNQLFEVMATVIAKVCDGLAYLVRLLGHTQEQFEKEQARMVQLNKALDDLDRSKRQYAKDEEARAQKIIELNRIVNDTELKSVDERIAAQEELNKVKMESLQEASIIANKELTLFKEQNQARIDELEKTKRLNGELTEEQKQELDELTNKLNELEVASIKATNAIVNAESEARDNIIGIIKDLTTEQIRERLKKLQAEKDAHDLEMQMIQEKLDAENAQIDILMKKVFAKNSLEEAVIFLRQRGIEVLKEEERNWEAIYGKLLAIRKVGALELGIDLKGQEMQKQIDMYTEALNRSIARNKTPKTTTTKKEGKSDEEKQREKEAEELAKYWAKVLDDSEKGLSAFLGEIRQADKEFRELSMNPIEIFDMNLDETLKTLDARKDEIQAKIFEIQNTNADTDEEREQQQQALAHYAEMYAEFESLRTAITQKAAKERAKLEEEQTKESLEHRLTEIERYYKNMKNEAMMENVYDFPGGGQSFFFAGIDDITSAKMNLAQAKDELEALKETLTHLDEGTEAYQEMADKIVEANMKVVESEKAVITSVLETTSTYINSVGQIAGSIQSLMSAKKKEVQNSKKTEGEKQALIEQIEKKERDMAVAQVAFSTASAIASVVADAAKAGWPAMIPILIAGIATVIAGIAQAKSAMAGYNDGGIIPGNSYTGDNVPIRTNSGEMVLTKKQQTELFNIANGHGGQSNQFYVVKAFEKAISRMPAPMLDYSEFSTFTSNVNSMNNLVRIK